MKVNRHGKPSKAYTSTLRAPTRADYESLVRGCLEAVISGSKDVMVAFAYTVKFPEDFPKGTIVEKVDAKTVRKIKANRLLKWLNDHGHTDITMEMLRVQQIAFAVKTTEFDKEIYEEL